MFHLMPIHKIPLRIICCTLSMDPHGLIIHIIKIVIDTFKFMVRKMRKNSPLLHSDAHHKVLTTSQFCQIEG